MFQFGKQDKALIDIGLKQFLGKYVQYICREDKTEIPERVF